MVLCTREVLLLLTTLAVSSTLASATEAPHRYQVASPDGTIQVQVRADKDLSYSVRLDGEPLLAPSRLGLGFGDTLQLGQNVQVVDVSTSERNETWKDDFGKFSTVKDNYRELRLTPARGSPRPGGAGVLRVARSRLQ